MKEDYDIYLWSNTFYVRWNSMMHRCYNPKSKRFKHYGGRGIKVEEYLQIFKNYVDYIKTLPGFDRVLEDKLQLDRIDNNKGYERGNLRWATCTQNNLNKQKSIFECGIYYRNDSKKYRSCIHVNKKRINLGCYSTYKEAKIARIKGLIDYSLCDKEEGYKIIDALNEGGNVDGSNE